MIRDTPWSTGTPCWVDLLAQQQPALEYYTGLFGWTVEIGPPETGGYGLAALDGRAVAGIGQLMTPDKPIVWTTYLASSDADTTAAVILDHGGAVLAEPMDVLDLGRMLIAQDPTGGVFGVWQAGTHVGVGRANEPGAPIWNELLTQDYDAALAFYVAVFGVALQNIGEGDFRYSIMQVNGAVVGGIGGAQSPDTPSHWRLYFGTSDTDATIARAVELGGTLVHAAHDSPFGRWGSVADPQGAAFSVITVPAED